MPWVFQHPETDGQQQWEAWLNTDTGEWQKRNFSPLPATHSQYTPQPGRATLEPTTSRAAAPVAVRNPGPTPQAARAPAQDPSNPWGWLSSLMTDLQMGANTVSTLFRNPTMVQGPPGTDPAPFYSAPFGLPDRVQAQAQLDTGSVLYSGQFPSPFVQRHEIGHLRGPMAPDLSTVPEWATKWAEGAYGVPLSRNQPKDLPEIAANLYYLGFGNPSKPSNPLGTWVNQWTGQ